MARRKLRIDDATKTKDLGGKTYIVTGANSGVGLKTTRQRSWWKPVERSLGSPSLNRRN